MNNKLILISLAFSCVSLSALAADSTVSVSSNTKPIMLAAATASPLVTLKNVSDAMIASLASNKSHLKDNLPLIQSIVNKNLIPIADLNRMGALVVGRQYWLSASTIERQQFISEFTRMVTSTYAAALASYDDDVVQFFPLREDYSAKHTINVQSMIIRKSGQRIAVNYNLISAGSGWKVYDFSIDNISMVQSYHSQFAAVLSQSGMKGLIDKLRQHNAAVD